MVDVTLGVSSGHNLCPSLCICPRQVTLSLLFFHASMKLAQRLHYAPLATTGNYGQQIDPLTNHFTKQPDMRVWAIQACQSSELCERSNATCSSRCCISRSDASCPRASSALPSFTVDARACKVSEEILALLLNSLADG